MRSGRLTIALFLFVLISLAQSTHAHASSLCSRKLEAQGELQNSIPVRPEFAIGWERLGFHLESATSADAEEVRAFIRASRAEIGLSPDYAADGRHLFLDFGEFASHFEGTSGEFLILRGADRRIAATASVQYVRPGTCELRSFYVRADLQGRRLGGTLARQILADAADLGYVRVELETDEANMGNAVRFYEGLGFKKTGGHWPIVYLSRALPLGPR